MGGAELRGSYENYYYDISYLLIRQPAHTRRSAHLRKHAPRSRSRKSSVGRYVDFITVWPTLLLPKDAPPADFPFDAAGSPDATRGATPARTRMASATCPTRILGCPCLAIPECHRCERGAARGNSSLLQSPAAGVDSHAPVDSGTDLTLAGQK